MQKEGLHSLYTLLKDYIPKKIVTTKNRNKSWQYGYNEKYDVVVISKTGEVGEVYDINGLRIALPKAPEYIEKNKNKWGRTVLPKILANSDMIIMFW